MRRLVALLGACALWILAIVGAIALAVWLRMSSQEARLLVIVVAFIAFFGAFLPIFRLGKKQS